MVDSDAVWRSLAAGVEPGRLGLGRVGDRWDLRSLTGPTFPWSRRDPLPVIRKVALHSMDFSGAELPSFRFFDCQFLDCVFDAAALRDWRMWNTSVRDCSFHEASLEGSGMGGDRRHPNTWLGVDFSRANLQDTGHYAETYVDCNFRDSRLKRVNFDGSHHVNSRFAGRMDEVEFRAAPRDRKQVKSPNVMDGVDLRAVTVRYGTFHELDLSHCLLPASPEHLRFDDRAFFAARVLEAARRTGYENVSLQVVMEGHLRDAPEGGGGPGFQHNRDLGETAHEIESAIALLRSCGAH